MLKRSLVGFIMLMLIAVASVGLAQEDLGQALRDAASAGDVEAVKNGWRKALTPTPPIATAPLP